MRAKEFILENTETKVVWNIDPNDMRPANKSYAQKGVLVRANIEELFQKTPKRIRLDPTDPTGGRNKIKDRATQAFQFWKDGGRMDPSVISIVNNQVNFLDGRHRLVAAFQMGEREAPIYIAPANNLRAAKEVLNLQKW